MSPPLVAALLAGILAVAETTLQPVSDIVGALILQLPIVALIIAAAYKGFIRFGPQVDKQDTFMQALYREEQAARRVAEERLATLTGTLKEATDVMERSVELNERIVQDFVRPIGTRTRSGDRRG